MKKSILATMTVAAAILASASLAQANAYLEMVSGTSWANTSSPNQGATLTATLGTWTAVAESGNASAAPSEIDLGIDNSSSSAQTKPLWVLLSVDATDGGPLVSGGWTLETTDNASRPTLNIYAYQSSAIYGVADHSAPLALTGLTLFGQDLGDNVGDSIVSGAVTGLHYYTEVIEIMPGSGRLTLSIDSTLRVPDGGFTMATLGAVLLGLAGIRSNVACTRSDFASSRTTPSPASRS